MATKGGGGGGARMAEGSEARAEENLTLLSCAHLRLQGLEQVKRQNKSIQKLIGVSVKTAKDEPSPMQDAYLSYGDRYTW